VLCTAVHGRPDTLAELALPHHDVGLDAPRR
jgi:hypothetical protein